MSDIIHLLPDHIANQIAAGEVIQRPASVVKELLENAVDAGAKTIRLDVGEAGRDYIKVTDDGKGMSPNDARMAFERHATSKISCVENLYALRTMGFRGEALASIAAVAQVKLLTRMQDSEVGTAIEISGSDVVSATPSVGPVGTVITVKNLFFNVPARRRFLKTNETEFRHIMVEFERVAMVNSDILFSIYHNNTLCQELPASSLKGRVLNLLGKKLDKNLLPIMLENPLVKISGFIGRPEGARRKGAAQYFFVNGRYMKHPYFHKAVLTAYEQLIPIGSIPNYVIYFELEPDRIDVNIHPTKTEIKFLDERAIFPLLVSTIRDALGSSVAAPTIDFDKKQSIDMPVYPGRLEEMPSMPRSIVNKDYNPFEKKDTSNGTNTTAHKTGFENMGRRRVQVPDLDWSNLLEQFNDEQQRSDANEPDDIFSSDQSVTSTQKQSHLLNFIYKDRYIITTLSSGLALIDYHRAHIRILYEQFLNDSANGRIEQQQLLFPESITFEQKDIEVAEIVMEEMSSLGFDFSPLGQNTYSILAAPSIVSADAASLVRDIVDTNISIGKAASEQLIEIIAVKLAENLAMPYGAPLTSEEADHLLAKLFATREPNYTPSGKVIISVLYEDDITKRFH